MSEKRINRTGDDGISLTKAFDAFVTSRLAEDINEKQSIDLLRLLSKNKNNRVAVIGFSQMDTLQAFVVTAEPKS